MKYLDSDLIRKEVERTDGRFFAVQFIKLSGKSRYLRGRTRRADQYRQTKFTIPVFDIEINAVRNLPTDRVFYLAANRLKHRASL